jgi:hypothetical protein
METLNFNDNSLESPILEEEHYNGIDRGQSPPLCH